MKRAKHRAICLFVASAFCVWSANARAQSAQADIKVFVAKYVAAFNAKDVARIYALYHPRVTACITPESKSYYDDAMAFQMRDPIPAGYTFRVMPVNENNVKALEATARFRIPPAREVQIDYQQGNDLGSVTLWLKDASGLDYRMSMFVIDDLAHDGRP